MKVSIITATWNSEKTLQACLDSVAQQTGVAEIEHIIVDGRSSDSTLSIVARYPHISQVVSAKDRGIYHAFNRGIRLATGDVVYFLNSDDCLYDNETIAQVISEFAPEYQYYLGSVLCNDPATGNSYFTVPKGTDQIDRKPCHQGFFCRRELFERFGSFNECFTIGADMYFMKTVMQHTKGIVTDRAIAIFSLQGMSSSDNNKAAMMRQHSMIDELLYGDNAMQELPEKLALEIRNTHYFKQLLLSLLKGNLNLSRFANKNVAIFGAAGLSQILCLLLQKQHINVMCFVVSSSTNKPQGLGVPVVALNELSKEAVDIVINCIEGKHESEISMQIVRAAKAVTVVSWRAFCRPDADILPNEQMKNSYFSCGAWCGTAHQIRRVTGNCDAYFFDWLVTLGHSYNFLLMDDQHFLQQGGWEIIADGIRLLDKYSGLSFQHEFKCDDFKINERLVEEHLPKAHDKFTYLKRKLIKDLKAAARPVVIRADSNITTRNQAEDELQSLKAVFSEINKQTAFVLVSANLQDELLTSGHLFIKVENVPVSNSDAWKGDNLSWDRVFLLAEEHLNFDRMN